MSRGIRPFCAFLSVWFALVAVAGPAWSAGEPLAVSVEKKVTVNDPEFVPLSEGQAEKGLKWYWYALGVLVVGGGVAAALAAGGNDTATTSPTTGSVSSTW
jgi:hypothetical protein